MKTPIKTILFTLILPCLLNAQISKEQDIINVNNQNSGLIVTEGIDPFNYANSHDNMLIVDSGFRIFPNPVNNILNFEITTDKEIILRGEVLDAGGRRVMEIQDFSVITEYRSSLDFSQLTAGRLFLRFFNSNGDAVKSFIILKMK